MKIAFVSPIPIFPAFGGNRARQFTLCQALIEQGHDVHFVFLPSRQQGAYDEAAHVDFLGKGNFHLLTRDLASNAIYYARRALSKVWRAPWTFLHGWTTDTNIGSLDEIYYAPFTRQISAIDKAVLFDCAIVSYIFFSRAFEGFDSRVFKIIDTHDSFTKAVGSKIQAKGLARADVVLAIQDQEAAVFRQELSGQATHVRTVSHFAPKSDPLPLSETLGATFVGSSFAANLASLKYLIDDVLPLILTQRPTFKLFVAGGICGDVTDHPSIIKLYQIAELRDAFVQAPISLNPITAGTGVKIKLIDSLSLGAPVVSTELGIMGIDPQFLSGVIVVPDGDAQALADAVIDLYDDTEKRRTLGAAAHQSAENWRRAQLNMLDGVLAFAEMHASQDPNPRAAALKLAAG